MVQQADRWRRHQARPRDKTAGIETSASHALHNRRLPRALVVAFVLGVFAISCGSKSSSSAIAQPKTFAEIDTAMSARVSADGLDGAGLLVVANGNEYRNTTYGGYSNETVIPIASASKWLTAATMMTLVDEGKVSLEDPVSKYLPEFTGETGTATIRQLLSHTSGIAQSSCIWEERQTLEQCVGSVAAQKPAYQPGTKFSYGNTSFSVAGRVIEVVTGQSFEKAFETRIATPLGMTHTRFDGNYYPTEYNPVPAASAESTLYDYGRFVEMLFNRGQIDGTRVLSEHAVLEMETDSVSGLNTSGDSAVRTTGIPTYGLGTWRDVTTTDDVGVITSGNGAYGFYPWIDRSRNGYGIVFVFDQRGSELAVPESQRNMHWVWNALDLLGVPQGSTPTTVYGR